LIAFNWLTYIYGVNSGHVVDTSLSFYINPLVSVLFGRLFFGEALSRMQLLAIALAAAGVVVAAVRFHTVPWLAILIAGSFAAYGALKKKLVLDSEVSVCAEALMLCPVGLIYLIVAEWGGGGVLPTLSGMQLALIPLMGAATSLPLLLYTAGVKRVSLSLTGVLMFLNPPIQLLLGVFAFHEEITATNWVLFGFAWTAVALFVAEGLFKGRGHQTKRRARPAS